MRNLDLSTITVRQPLPDQLPMLRSLWKEAFGDSDAFLDTFFHTAFSPNRCNCITIDNHVVAALYWFDCSLRDKPVAYIYAVATAKAHQGQRLCHILMEHTHKYLQKKDYAGTILVPGSPSLFQFYEKMGYQTCTYIDEIHYIQEPLSFKSVFNNQNEMQSIFTQEYTSGHRYPSSTSFLRHIGKNEYTRLRRQFLPANSIIQENENLDFLETQAQFYAGEDFLLTAYKQGETLHGIELLGNTSAIPGIVHALGCTNGVFRTLGNKPFAMYFPLNHSQTLPQYFGFAFD